jgi:hypothetical protein
MRGGDGMGVDNEAILSSNGNMTSFSANGRVIRFRMPESLVRYEAVTKWDDGYIECLATYDNPLVTEEEYIDLVPILERLYFDSEAFLSRIERVRVSYA